MYRTKGEKFRARCLNELETYSNVYVKLTDLKMSRVTSGRKHS